MRRTGELAGLRASEVQSSGNATGGRAGPMRASWACSRGMRACVRACVRACGRASWRASAWWVRRAMVELLCSSRPVVAVKSVVRPSVVRPSVVGASCRYGFCQRATYFCDSRHSIFACQQLLLFCEQVYFGDAGRSLHLRLCGGGDDELPRADAEAAAPHACRQMSPQRSASRVE